MYTEYKNLTCKTFNTERVKRWRLILEEYNPDLIYIQGSRNIVAGVSSRLDIVGTNNLIKSNMSSLAEKFSLEKHPVHYKTIM